MPFDTTWTCVPLSETSDVFSRAYGCELEQPGSSRKTARLPGVIHCLKSMMCSLLFTASPGWSVDAGIAWVMSFLNGANCPVTRPGAPSPHAHDTKPEQSDRYGFH